VNGVHDPQKGAQNFADIVGNANILGVVGPFNSNVARATIPVANRASLVMISPSNTNECLTQTFSYCDPQPAALRPTGKNNYFRIAAPDTVQGPAMADFAVDTLKATKIAIWSDNETFGKGVADNFGKEVVKKGGTVVVRQDFDWKTTNDFRPFLQRAKDAGAQAIYAGATSATHGCIPRAQMKSIFTTDIPYLGPDGIGTSDCITDAGDNANANLYFTNAAAEAVKRRRSGLRAGVSGRILDFALIVIIAAFLILLGTKIIAQGGSFFVQIFAFAIANGGIYALIALGYTMVYGIIELINFARG